MDVTWHLLQAVKHIKSHQKSKLLIYIKTTEWTIKVWWLYLFDSFFFFLKKTSYNDSWLKNILYIRDPNMYNKSILICANYISKTVSQFIWKSTDITHNVGSRSVWSIRFKIDVNDTLTSIRCFTLVHRPHVIFEIVLNQPIIVISLFYVKYFKKRFVSFPLFTNIEFVLVNECISVFLRDQVERYVEQKFPRERKYISLYSSTGGKW